MNAEQFKDSLAPRFLSQKSLDPEERTSILTRSMSTRNEAIAALRRIEQFLINWEIPNVLPEVSADTGLAHPPLQPSMVCFERAGIGTLTAAVNPPLTRVVIDLNSPGVEFLFSGSNPLASRDDRGGLSWRRPVTFQEFADFWSAIAKPATRVSWNGLGGSARLLITYKFFDPVNDGEGENAEPISTLRTQTTTTCLTRCT